MQIKYIQKTATPQFFIIDTNGLSLWSDYNATKKRTLRKHILDTEQSNLCCYCEKSITEHTVSSHCEHIKPKSIDIATLTFDYNNIIVSCEFITFFRCYFNDKVPKQTVSTLQ